MHLQTFQRSGQGIRIGSNLFGKTWPALILIGNAETATRVDVLDLVAIRPQCPYQFCHSLHGCRERFHIGDLGTDVYTDAGNFEGFVLRRSKVQSARSLDGYAEFVLMQSRRNIWMGFGWNVGVYTQGNAC